MIPEDTYKIIIDNVINVCTDVCLKYNDKYLLIQRKEEPCKGVFWPVGGRIHKNETADQAARRKILEEIGIIYTGELKPVGFYEDQYKENSFSDNTNYCTISIVFFGILDSIENIKLDDTSEKWGFFEDLPERFRINPFR